MSKKLKPEVTDPTTKLILSIQDVGWGFIVPAASDKDDVINGMLIGNNEFLDLVHSYLPENFAQILKEKMEKKG
ncbi:MAG TPA: hypothetical protein VI911_09015 [Patescibacteria group bacterium]|nr:MAG: hypothetical protein UR43_C0005G0029 [candidate division TM6 bacterium GW2011_GWF2_33_332]HLD91138.1 hypothetical protein [Patescibacteria group bacterium]